MKRRAEGDRLIQWLMCLLMLVCHNNEDNNTPATPNIFKCHFCARPYHTVPWTLRGLACLIHTKICVPTEKAMASHSSTLAWKIPWMGEPGRLQSMGSLWVGRDWATSLSLFTFTQWRRQWQPTPVFLPGESQGQGSLVGWSLWGRTELDTTEAT